MFVIIILANYPNFVKKLTFNLNIFIYYYFIYFLKIFSNLFYINFEKIDGFPSLTQFIIFFNYF
jgi:hypothetical protein